MRLRSSLSLFVLALAFLAASALSAQALPAPAIAPLPGTPETFRSLAVTRVGNGRPVILIPGLLSSGDVWSATVEHLKGKYECHVLTLPGFAGRAAVPPPFLQTVRDDVLRYIDEKKLDHPVLVGHSLGGFVALWAAATAPGKVGKVVAVDGVPFLPALMSPGATVEASRPQAEQIRKLYSSFTREQLAAQSKMGFAALITDPKQAEAATAWSAASDPAAVGQAVSEMMTTDLRDTVAAIPSPVLLLGAAGQAQDEAARKPLAAAYEAQVAKIPHHRVELAPTRHFIMLDDPAFFFAKLDSFLAEAGK